MDPFEILQDASLRGMNTFGVDARARELVELEDLSLLPAALDDIPAEQVLVLGGGSNILFTRPFDGRVIKLAEKSAQEAIHVEKGSQHDRVSVAAGMNWDRFVRWSLEQGYAGLENLILIPGSVGAAPIQNIGAYGREVSEFVASVEVFDRQQGIFSELDTAACRFSYRDSIFKQERGRYVVTRIHFKLPRHHPLRTDYAGVQEGLDALGVTRPEARDVARVVESLRLAKLPNPAEIGNAGSFFKNPIVPDAEVDTLLEKYPDLPNHAVEGGRKVSAAWLIQACGLKGFREGDAGISNQHALVLVNHGAASGAQLWRVAMHVIESVQSRFGIRLEPEPLVK